MSDRIDCIAAATAECGMQSWLTKYLPAERHEDLRGLLFDLAVGALHALKDVEVWRVPEPSEN